MRALALMLMLAGCAGPACVPSVRVVTDRSEVPVYVAAKPSAAATTCLPEPKAPGHITAGTQGGYIAALVAAENDCRAKLSALAKPKD